MKHEYIFKDAAGDDPVAKAIADLTAEFATFKTAQTGRLDDVERKQLADINRRIDEIVAKAQRPGAAGGENDAAAVELKALNKFYKSGVAALDDAERKTLNWGTPGSGGYITAPTYSNVIVQKITEFSPIRSLASVLSVAAQKIFLPVETTALSGGWVTETGDRPTSEPVFDQLAIENYEHAAIVPVSEQLLEDSIVDLGGYIATEIGKQFGKTEASAFVKGDGNGKPDGVLKTPGAFRQVAADNDGSDIVAKAIELFYTIEGTYAARGSWLMNRRTQGVLRAAADATTKGTLWSDGLANGTPATFLGRAVFTSPDMDDLISPDSPPDENTYPILFGDFGSGYQIIDRIAVMIKRDDYTSAGNGIVKFHARRRVGGKVKQPEAFVVMKASAA